MSDRDSSHSPSVAQDFLPGFDALPVKELPEWQAIAYAALVAFVKKNPGRQFMSEEFRAGLPSDFPKPRDARRWGGIFLEAKSAGLIDAVGYKTCASSATAHGRPVTLWEAIG